MTPSEFPGMNVVLAKNQEEYFPLPAFVHPRDPDYGRVTTCWQLSEDEICKLIDNGGRLYFTAVTFGYALQPQLPSVDPPAELLEQPASVGPPPGDIE